MKITKSFFLSLVIITLIMSFGYFTSLKLAQKQQKLENSQILEKESANSEIYSNDKEIQNTKEIQNKSQITDDFSLNSSLEKTTLLAATAKAPAEAKLFLPLSLKDMSKYNLGELLIWKEPGIVECEPWGPGMGYAPCLPGTLEGDPPCPIFMDCDGDGHYWFKGEDCDENCVTCYKGSPHTTPYPDGRDQDCDGVVDDLVECVPQYGAAKPFGYTPDCQWVPKGQTDFILVNEGEMGKIPTDEIHCKKVFGECTPATGGFGNCTVSKTPGYFVKGGGVSCGGGIWRTDQGDSIFYCGKSLRENSYRGYYGCGGPCPNCIPQLEPEDACSQCDINSAFDYGNASKTKYGPWGLCHGYSTVTCQEMVGCTKKIVPNNYH